MDIQGIKNVTSHFDICGEVYKYETISNGHINKTYKVSVKEGNNTVNYILQSVNTNIFKEPEKMMGNTIAVTHHVKEKLPEGKKNKVLTFVKAHDGNYYHIEDNVFYRMSVYAENSYTYLTGDSSIIKEAGLAFGEFLGYLCDFPATELYESIKDFHNTCKRYENLLISVENNLSGRRENAAYEIEKYKELADISTLVYKQYEKGILPPRVTHNDTKISNVLFSSDNKYIFVIDLDTVMCGPVAFDFGDAVRTCASSAAEDEKDTSLMHLDIDKFSAFTDGFLESGIALSEEEKDSLPYGAIAMTLECGMRFLTDYIDGDVYFHTDYEDHNLVRARTQLALGLDMIAKLEQMKNIINNHS